jgi:hypothetical protein
MVRRQFGRTLICALLTVPLFAATAHDSQADDATYVDCSWSPYKEAWGCMLPQTFTDGRFNSPPDYRQDPASVGARERAWLSAKGEPGARPKGHLGVFIPSSGGWMFVPGSSWSPGDEVSLPKPPPAKH